MVARNSNSPKPFRSPSPPRTQEETDYYWNKLTADGGQESQCGWLKDKFGLSWQVVPECSSSELLSDPDKTKAQRVMQAMLQMKKIDIAALQRAAAQRNFSAWHSAATVEEPRQSGMQRRGDRLTSWKSDASRISTSAPSGRLMSSSG